MLPDQTKGTALKKGWNSGKIREKTPHDFDTFFLLETRENHWYIYGISWEFLGCHRHKLYLFPIFKVLFFTKQNVFQKLFNFFLFLFYMFFAVFFCSFFLFFFPFFSLYSFVIFLQPPAFVSSFFVFTLKILCFSCKRYLYFSFLFSVGGALLTPIYTNIGIPFCFLILSYFYFSVTYGIFLQLNSSSSLFT